MLMNVVFQEEQADDETYEQFEERVVNKRAGQMFLSIKRRLRNNNILFSDLVHQNNRKQVSAVETEGEQEGGGEGQRKVEVLVMTINSESPALHCNTRETLELSGIINRGVTSIAKFMDCINCCGHVYYILLFFFLF